MRYLRTLVFLLAVTAATGSASADSRNDTVLDAITGKEFAALMAEYGYEVKLEKDEDGDPYLVSSKGETSFVVIFYGCDKNKVAMKRVCGDVQFRSSYEAPEAASLNRMNKWNTDFRFGKAYIDDDGDPTIEMVLNMSGGVTPSYVRNILKWWSIVLRDFEEHIGWK